MEENSILELQSRMESGELSSVRLTEAYLEQIKTIDRQGPSLNAVIEINREAVEIAMRLDEERRLGKIRGPMHGIPILIKDNIDTSDKMMTTSGSLALEGSVAREDAYLVKKLREAGAVLLGKTNLSEWANFRSSHSSSGWSSRGGQTRNPYALDRSPCGSSSGSAAAAAANLCAAAVGTETDGSIICPAQSQSLVGIKPTIGLVSGRGVIPIAHSQDTAGPMARTVVDAAILLDAMAGADEADPVAFMRPVDVTKSNIPDKEVMGMQGKRIGVARSYFGFDLRVDVIMEACLSILKDLGAELIDPVDLIDEADLVNSELEVLSYEFKADLNAYLARLDPDARVHSMEEIIQFNERNRERVMPYFGQERMIRAQSKGPLIQKRYLNALARNHRLSRVEGIDHEAIKHRLDAFVAPTGGPAWLIDLICGDNYGGGGFSTLAAVAGYPHITVPAGFVFGLPVGISFFGQAWSEHELIQLAYSFEQASKVRQPPRFLASADLRLDFERKENGNAHRQALLI